MAWRNEVGGGGARHGEVKDGAPTDRLPNTQTEDYDFSVPFVIPGELEDELVVLSSTRSTRELHDWLVAKGHDVPLRTFQRSLRRLLLTREADRQVSGRADSADTALDEDDLEDLRCLADLRSVLLAECHAAREVSDRLALAKLADAAIKCVSARLKAKLLARSGGTEFARAERTVQIYLPDNQRASSTSKRTI